MTDRELMFALQCCSPTAKSDRDCASCPFGGNDNCHSMLCDTTIDLIMRNQSKNESVVYAIDAVTDAVNHLRGLC